MTARDAAEESKGTKPRYARRRILQGIGAGGLASAATVFGFASPASARGIFACCRLCCTPNSGHTLAQCETGSYYVWTCTDSAGGTCYCCEHNSPCHYGCGGRHATYSVYSCTK